MKGVENVARPLLSLESASFFILPRFGFNGKKRYCDTSNACFEVLGRLCNSLLFSQFVLW